MVRDSELHGSLIREGDVIRILLIDDQPVIEVMLRRLIRRAPDLELHFCSNPSEALEVCKRVEPSVILLDLIMAEMDGLTLLRRFRGRPETRMVPIIILSVDERPKIKARLFAEGANDYLIKLPDELEVIARLRYHATHKALLDNYHKDLTDSQARRHALLENTVDGIITVDEQGHIESFNTAAERIFSYTSAEVLNQNVRILFPPPYDHTSAESIQKILRNNLNGQLGVLIEVEGRCKDGTTVPLMVTVNKEPLIHENLFTAIIRDLTEQRRLEKQLKQQAEMDALTGLPNRALFLDRLSQGIAMAARTKEEVVLLVIDLDNFKEINDTLGHEAGDILLLEAADRLSHAVRESDTVARAGGDEFTIILYDITHTCYVELVSRIILANLARAFTVNGESVFITCSIGIAIFPQDGQDAQHLLKNADTAMYQAKAMGRNGFRFFTPQMNEEMQERAYLIRDLRLAVEREEFELYYQPIVDPHRRKVIGAEALLRWDHPEQGMISPDKFIPITEETGLIRDIGAWVLRTACKQAAIWANDSNLPPLKITVNVSARQFKGFKGLVADVLKETGLNPAYLGLELTENMLLDSTESVIDTMDSIRGLGVDLYVDDFGTGYSSLSYLQRFPVNAVKIDSSFVFNLGENKSDKAIVEAIIAMGHCLNLRVIAEGVETEEQMAFLAENKCNLLQGYMYSRPLPVEQFYLWGEAIDWNLDNIKSS
ncbi:MAG: EAL domain-containing protein [Magnetococcales bacterium]|nr:EAL domain-containing protein [Magnetococcales bacterium]